MRAHEGEVHVVVRAVPDVRIESAEQLDVTACQVGDVAVAWQPEHHAQIARGQITQDVSHRCQQLGERLLAHVRQVGAGQATLHDHRVRVVDGEQRGVRRTDVHADEEGHDPSLRRSAPWVDGAVGAPGFFAGRLAYGSDGSAHAVSPVNSARPTPLRTGEAADRVDWVEQGRICPG